MSLYLLATCNSGNEMDSLGKERFQLSSPESKFSDEHFNHKDNEVQIENSSVEIKELEEVNKTVFGVVTGNEKSTLEDISHHSRTSSLQTKCNQYKNCESGVQEAVLKTYNEVASSPIFPCEFYPDGLKKILRAHEEPPPPYETLNEDNERTEVEKVEGFDRESKSEKIPTFKIQTSSTTLIDSNIMQEKQRTGFQMLEDTEHSVQTFPTVSNSEFKSKEQQENDKDVHDEILASSPSISDFSTCNSDNDVEENSGLKYQDASNLFFTYGDVSFDSRDKSYEKEESCGDNISIEEIFEDSGNVTMEQNNVHLTEETTIDSAKDDSTDKIINEIKTDIIPQNDKNTLENSSGIINEDSSVQVIYPTSSTSTNACMTSPKIQGKIITNKHDENTDIVIPNEDTAARIVSNVEFYFTDFNILKNNFLLKHIRKNKEGYVSLKLITSFRKVKAITRDWRVVAFCLERSKILELNPEKNKLRRKEPIPKIEETSFGKTIVIFNLPFQHPTSEQLEELFSKFGKIAYLEVLTSKSKNCNLYHKKCQFFNRDIASHKFGVVEFENYKDFESSLKDEEGYLPKENTMNIVPLVAKYYRSKPRKFRYKSSISYPRGGFKWSNPNSEYPKDIYASPDPNYIKSSRSYSTEDALSKGKLSNGTNYNRWYFCQSDASKFYSKQIDTSYKSQVNFPGQKHANYGRKAPDSWRQNRQLKTNTSMNIESRFPATVRKTEAKISK